jgi:hypothetical protein
MPAAAANLSRAASTDRKAVVSSDRRTAVQSREAADRLARAAFTLRWKFGFDRPAKPATP